MFNIALPKKIDFKDTDKANRQTVVIEPLFPGYGTTVGNALRRVLLSSIPGAAVVGVKIEGADHEFMALPNIKQDVLEIILNLKQLNLKIHSDEIVKLELEVHGEKEVKAKDIKKNAEVEIINPGLTLATITDMAGLLKMEIYASRGLGYETIENRENRKKEIGYIEIDSIFSPVRAVGINIENTRVGKMTNWDKLTLDIETNGGLTPQEALEKAVAILLEQFNSLENLLQGGNEVVEETTAAPLEAAEVSAVEEPVKEEAEEIKEVKKEKKSKKKEKEIADKEEIKEE